jgi:hypothetical protein
MTQGNSLMNNAEIFNSERLALRDELHSLKSCQITFLTTSVTATGALLGIAVSLKQSFDNPGMIFLFPLVILIPSWWIFFDKATTITRIIGYYRILEKLLLGLCTAKNFVGWENALGMFRDWQENNRLEKPFDKPEFKHIFKIGILRTSHLYWVVAYYIFFGLSTLCAAFSTVYMKENRWIGFVSAAIVLLSAIWNGRVVLHLIYGRNSYNSNEKFWEKILKVQH